MIMQPVQQQPFKFFGRQYSGPEGAGPSLPPAPIVNTFQVQPYHPYKQVHHNQVRPNFPTGKRDDFRGDLEDTKFDGKRARKTIQRRTVDYSSSVIEQIKGRIWKKSMTRCSPLQPDVLYYAKMTLPRMCLENPVNCVATRFVRTSTNKVRCPIFCSAWTPEGRRLVTGASSGEFTLWNGLTFNFETILQAHESAVRAMEWSNNDMWLLSGDNSGIIKYWQSNMNNVKMFQAHVDPIRGVSFSPTDNKFATCSDDGLVKIWDFYRCFEEKTLRGHGADVKSVDWHPTKSLLVSGSKDSQQPVKLWDPKSGTGLATIHGHKSTVMDLEWNENGNWLLTASRDHLIKIYDIRMMKEIQTFRGHKKEATAVNWHPIHESFFASAGSDGSIFFWMLGCEKDLGSVDNAHDGMIWTIKWHPIGHIVCTGSNDHTSKFWTRNRPGDLMKDRHNLNTSMLGAEEDYEYSVPSFSDTSMVNSSDVKLNQSGDSSLPLARQMSQESSIIPGLITPSIPGLDSEEKKSDFDSMIPRPFGETVIKEIAPSNITSYRQSGFRLPTKEELESGKVASAMQLSDVNILSEADEEETEPILYEADEDDKDLDEEIRNEFLQHAFDSEKERSAPRNDGKGLLPTPEAMLQSHTPNEPTPMDENVNTKPPSPGAHFDIRRSIEDRPDNQIKPLFDNFEELQEKYEWNQAPLHGNPRHRDMERNHFEPGDGNRFRERSNSHQNSNSGWRQNEDYPRENDVPNQQGGFMDGGPVDRHMERGPRFHDEQHLPPPSDFHVGAKRPYFEGPPDHGFFDPSMNNVQPPFQPRFPNEPPFREPSQPGLGFDGEAQINHSPPHMHPDGFGNMLRHREQLNNDNRFDDSQTIFAPNGPRQLRPRLS